MCLYTVEIVSRHYQECQQYITTDRDKARQSNIDRNKLKTDYTESVDTFLDNFNTVKTFVKNNQTHNYKCSPI